MGGIPRDLGEIPGDLVAIPGDLGDPKGLQEYWGGGA